MLRLDTSTSSKSKRQLSSSSPGFGDGDGDDKTLAIAMDTSESEPTRPRAHILTQTVSQTVSHLRLFLSRIRTNLTSGTPPSSSSSYKDEDDSPHPAAPNGHGIDIDPHPDPDLNGITVSESHGYVEKVVVEQSWGSGSKQPTSHSHSSSHPDHDEHRTSKSGGTQPVQMRSQSQEETDIMGLGHGNGSASSVFLVRMVRVWHRIKHFFYPRPFDVGSETRYNQDDWYSKKIMAQIASIWLIINWALSCISVPHPWTVIDVIFYGGIAPAFTFPVFLMVMYSWPRDRRMLYQLILTIALWMWPFILLINIYICNFYTLPGHAPTHKLISCNGKDFINIFFYATALQAIGLFGLKLDRAWAAGGAGCWFVVSLALIVPDHTVWWRSVVNFAVFHAFGTKTVRDEGAGEDPVQGTPTRTSQRASDDRVEASVDFVRVPLNSALLAAQSMEASGTVSKSLEVEFDALMGSLTMMSQVLNDVLDFNRLDSGQFELVSKPYAFHQTTRGLFIPLQLATAQKGLTLTTELDPNIDRVARCAAYRAMGEKEDVIQKHLQEHPDVDGVVIGDEARFRQIITNFASNACKFTPEGGSVTLKTRLIIPSVGPDGSPEMARGNSEPRLSASRLAQHDYDNAKDESIVVRVEVSDTGCGIDGSELTGPKLFSAFNQTDTGKQQGGKGTGLGLALVRHIVKLSGGRLGVKTKPNQGSTFWVELPLGVGRQALLPSSGIKMSDSEGSMSSDMAKVRAAARERNAVPGELRTKSLTAVVDAAALKASEMSSVMRSSTLMHSTIMEQGGRVDLVVDSNTPSVPLASIRASPSIMSGAPTPGTDLSFSFRSRSSPKSEKSQDLSIARSTSGSGSGCPNENGKAEGEEELEGIPPEHSTTSDITFSESAVTTDAAASTSARSTRDSSTTFSTPTTSDPGLSTSPSTSTSTPRASNSLMPRPTHIPIPSPPAFKVVGARVSSPSAATSTTTSTYASAFSSVAPSPFAQPSSSTASSTPTTVPTSVSASTSPLALFDNSFRRTNTNISSSATAASPSLSSTATSPLSSNSAHPEQRAGSSSGDFAPGLPVLVVDDDGITRKMMERILSRHGCAVTLAENGRVALELILGDSWDEGVLRLGTEGEENRLSLTGTGAEGTVAGSATESRTSWNLAEPKEWKKGRRKDKDKDKDKERRPSSKGGVKEKDRPSSSRSGTGSGPPSRAMSEQSGASLSSASDQPYLNRAVNVHSHSNGMAQSHSHTQNLDRAQFQSHNHVPNAHDREHGHTMRFALVFLDNQMPVLSGLRTVEILRRLGRRDFVVGLTGNALLPDQEEYLQAGVDIVLTKPVLQNKIQYVLKEADTRRRLQQDPREQQVSLAGSPEQQKIQVVDPEQP